MKMEKVTNSLIRISKNHKLNSLCEERFGKDYLAKLLSNPDDIFITSLNSFINELDKYDFLKDSKDVNDSKNNVDTEISLCKKNLKTSNYSLTNNSDILKKKNSNHLRSSGNFSKRVFNKYTCPYGQFFDPTLQHGGESIFNDQDIKINRCITTENTSLTLSPKRKKKETISDRIDFNYNKKVYEIKEHPWNSTQDYFFNNNCFRIEKSPDKVTNRLI